MADSMELAAIRIHPLKSAAPIALDACEVLDRGPRHDRRYMVVDVDGVFVTQRDHPRMALIRTSLVPEGVELRAPDLPAIVLRPADAPRRTVTVWRSTIDAVDAGPEAAEWISTFLGRSAAIVFMPDDVRRAVNPRYGLPDDIVSFADGYPFLLANEASLEDLNARLAAPVSMERFRPNFVVRGSSPWAEDAWRTVRIGEVELAVTKPCERCVITTIDPRTGEKGKEPLRTLAGFRDRGAGPLFGLNLIARSRGTVRVGDPVVVG